MDEKTKKYIEKLEELLFKSIEIATFYGKIIDSKAVFLYAHGIKASDEEVERGHKLINEFKDLRSEASRLLDELPNESEINETKT